MRTLIFAAFVVVVAIRLAAWANAAPAEQETPTAEPLVTVVATITPQPTTTPVLTHGEAQRVRFKPGAYGESLQVEGQETFVLWAKAGQVMKLTSDRTFAAKLSDPSGNDVLFEQLTATLPSSGDYLLTVAGNSGFTFYVDIR